MITTLPAWVRHEEVDVDRVMIAAWLWFVDEVDVARGIARAAAPGVTDAELDEIASRVSDWQECYDDPQRFAWSFYALSGSGGGWLEWGEVECEKIAADVAVLAQGIVARSLLAVAS